MSFRWVVGVAARPAVGYVLAMALVLVTIQPAVAQVGDRTHAVRAEVVTPSVQTITRELNLPATLAADEQVDLFAKTSGYVSEVRVDIGSRVTKGQALVTIDVPEMADELSQATALIEASQAKVRALQAKALQAARMVDTARAEVARHVAQQKLDRLNFERKQKLHEGNAIPKQVLDEAENALAIADAELDIAQAKIAGAQAEHQAVLADVDVALSGVQVGRSQVARLNTLMKYATIRAPFDGVVTQRNVDTGTFVRSAAEGTTPSLLTVQKDDEVRVVLQVPEPDAPFVKPGTKVQLVVRALSGTPVAATVTRIAGALDPQTRTMRAEVDLDNSEHRFTPGMYARVRIELQVVSDAMVVPSKAIRMYEGTTAVFIADGGVTKSKAVSIGYDDGIWAEIVSGLTGNEQVITSTSGAVVPGSAINPVSSDS